MKEILNFIDDEFRQPESEGWMDVYEPATGNVYARLADSDASDIDSAFSSASKAFPAWSSLEGESRARHLNRVADTLEDHLQEFALAESRDTGKPITLAQTMDIPRAIANFRFFASAASQFSSESHAMGNRAINVTLRRPLGTVGCISPWNLPLYLLSWKVAPALAAGNTVVAKPSELSPMTAAMLGEICRKAEFPPGVLNIVHGRGDTAGAALTANPSLKALSFTGSTRTGTLISRAAADRFIKLSLEMGGKNAVLVFADCDLESTVDEVVRAAFSNQGQICLCGSRILIEKSIYADFRQLLVERVQALQVGDPSVETTQQGAVISKDHQQKVLHYISLAKREGGQILCGGEPVNPMGRCEHGWFVQPTLIEGLSNRCRTNQEEIFGPVATLQSFESDVEALSLANDSSYGLAASIWSNDLSRCHRLAENIECGVVWINCWLKRDLRTPFGGMKQSGLGREGGNEVMRFFTTPKNICLEYGE